MVSTICHTSFCPVGVSATILMASIPTRLTRHLTYTGGQDVATSHGYCRGLLDSFPSLKSISFQEIHGLSWAVLRGCLSYPRINFISFANRAELTATDGFPIDDEASNISISLGTFSYDVRLWRGKYYSQGRHIVPSYHRFQLAVTRESQCLRDLVPRMNNTLRQLSLPMESAPLLQMANVPWPNLRELSIGGQHWTSERVELLPTFLATLPSLDKLTVRICFEAEVIPGWERAPILGKQPTPQSTLSGMRSLTVAYPDPNDHIFLIDTSTLRHLSICDWPRHYNILQHRFSPPCGYPILSSAECLAVLQRTDLPELSSPELVYQADKAGSDDDLLQYVASKLCNLAHLELHRYRADREEDVDHVCPQYPSPPDLLEVYSLTTRSPLRQIHIARLLTAARSLRTLRLNLDFRDDHGAYCGEYAVRREWWYKFRDTLGWEIVDAVQDACPLLGCVELLYHGHPTATWAEFHPSRCAEPRFVLSYDKDHRCVSWSERRTYA